MSNDTLPIRDRGLVFVIFGCAIAGMATLRLVSDAVTNDLDALGIVLAAVGIATGAVFLFFGLRLRRKRG